jgi:hypothetical protein
MGADRASLDDGGCRTDYRGRTLAALGVELEFPVAVGGKGELCARRSLVEAETG